MAVNSYREDEFMENTDKKKIMRRLFSICLHIKARLLPCYSVWGLRWRFHW